MKKIRPETKATLAATLMLAGMVFPAAHAAPPPASGRNIPLVTVPMGANSHNTRNRNGKDKIVRVSAGTIKRNVPPAKTIAEVQKVDYLLFCNQPERLTMAGAYADAKLVGGRTYRIFFHYRNMSGKAGKISLNFHGTAGKPMTLQLRQGIADAQNDPPRAGRQAMKRYLQAQPVDIKNARGAVGLPLDLHAFDTASGIVTVRPSQDCRFRIVFNEGQRTVRGARVVAVPAPRREVSVTLNDSSPVQYVRIGGANDLPEEEQKNPVISERMDGSYGLVYAFTVRAPVGRRVRVTFSPRGGQAGLVAQLNGTVRTSAIVEPSGLAVFAEETVSESGFALVTMPFGGVFYPVEIAFHLQK